MYLVLIQVLNSESFNKVVGVRGSTNHDLCREQAYQQLGLPGDWRTETKIIGTLVQQINSAALGLQIIVAR